MLVDIYNTKFGSKGPIAAKMDAEGVLKALEARTGCSEEECVVCKLLAAVKGTVYEAVVRRIKEIAFKVEGPGELTALLDNFLITRLCRQIEANNTGVKFGGVLTIDFMIPPVISSYGDPGAVWKDYEAAKWKQLQFVFNIDHRMGMGQHWTALTFDTDAGEAQYFDSYGMPPPDGVLVGSRPSIPMTDDKGRFLTLLRHWIDDVRQEFTAHRKPMKLIHNTVQHQSNSDQSNCGPYSVLFLALRGKGVPFDRINRDEISTAEIEKIRDRLYRRTPDYVPEPPAPLPPPTTR